MNKQTPLAFLIIASIFMLALKDSASFIHTLLHAIPNPWHTHEVLHTHTPHINPLEIHKHLQHKHAHHHHPDHPDTHAHDLTDHFQSAPSHEQDHKSEEIKTSLKIDFYFQSKQELRISFPTKRPEVFYFSMYTFSAGTNGIRPPHQPPQL